MFVAVAINLDILLVLNLHLQLKLFNNYNQASSELIKHLVFFSAGNCDAGKRAGPGECGAGPGECGPSGSGLRGANLGP